MAVDFRYLDRVFKKVASLKIGESFAIKKDSESYEKFVETVKLIIDNSYDTVNGYQIVFNDSYTAVKKIDYATLPKIIEKEII